MKRGDALRWLLLRPMHKTLLVLVLATGLSGCATLFDDARAMQAPPTTTLEEVRMFPTVTAANLNGDAYTLPADFEAEYNIVMLAYLIQHQNNVNTWLPFLGELEGQYADLRYYELPTLPDYNPLRQRSIDDGMRSGILDLDTRSRTITVYTDVAAFNAQLGIRANDTMQILLVRRDGTVLWRSLGSFDPAKAAGLRAVLAQALPT